MYVIKVTNKISECKSLCKHRNYNHMALLFFLTIRTLLMGVTEGVIHSIYQHVNMKIRPHSQNFNIIRDHQTRYGTPTYLYMKKHDMWVQKV